MKKQRISSSRGFSLIELLIAVVLFGLITSFVLLSYGKVSEQLFATALAYDVALSFRQAQSFGVSTRQFRAGNFQTFDAAYGLRFENSRDDLFVLFADGKVGGDSLRYDGTHSDSGCVSTDQSECVSIFKIGRGNRIERFCGVLPGDGGRDVPDVNKSEECNVNSTPPGSSETISFLDVLFKRPQPDAIIRSNASVQGTERYKGARVYLISPRGERRVVEVVNTGQISIK